MVTRQSTKLPDRVRRAIDVAVQENSSGAVSVRDVIQRIRAKRHNLALGDEELSDQIAREALDRGLPVQFDSRSTRQ